MNDATETVTGHLQAAKMHTFQH